MAICFELVVNFGDNLEAAQAAALTSPGPWVLHAGTHRIPLHRPLLTTAGPHIELSVLPVAVSSTLRPRRQSPRNPAHGSEVDDGGIPGLVLCERLHTELGLSADYTVFQPGYRWIPYPGEEPSHLTAD